MWNKKVLLLAALVLAVAVGAGAWFGRERVLSWYYLHQLAAAQAEDRDRWIDRIAGLGEAALPGLLEFLHRPDETTCQNAAVALGRITEGWREGDARRAEFVQSLVNDYPKQSEPGRQQAVLLLARWIQGEGPDSRPLCVLACQLLKHAGQGNAADLQPSTVDLAKAMLNCGQVNDHLLSCKAVASAALSSKSTETRVRGIQLAVHPSVNLLDSVIPLLSDANAEVRRAAMLAVGPMPKAITTDNLLPWLHDTDADVRRFCEAALLAREDFQREHLGVARLITSPVASVRLQVLETLQRDATLEPGVWLMRLSHDPAPEVRAAAVRAAVGQELVDLSDRVSQMVTSDPSPTVSQLARYYLSIGKYQH